MGLSTGLSPLPSSRMRHDGSTRLILDLSQPNSRSAHDGTVIGSSDCHTSVSLSLFTPTSGGCLVCSGDTVFFKSLKLAAGASLAFHDVDNCLIAPFQQRAGDAEVKNIDGFCLESPPGSPTSSASTVIFTHARSRSSATTSRYCVALAFLHTSASLLR